MAISEDAKQKDETWIGFVTWPYVPSHGWGSARSKMCPSFVTVSDESICSVTKATVYPPNRSSWQWLIWTVFSITPGCWSDFLCIETICAGIGRLFWAGWRENHLATLWSDWWWFILNYYYRLTKVTYVDGCVWFSVVVRPFVGIFGVVVNTTFYTPARDLESYFCLGIYSTQWWETGREFEKRRSLGRSLFRLRVYWLADRINKSCGCCCIAKDKVNDLLNLYSVKFMTLTVNIIIVIVALLGLSYYSSDLQDRGRTISWDEYSFASESSL